MYLCLANNVYAVDYCADANLVFGILQTSDPSPSTSFTECSTNSLTVSLDSDNNPDYIADVPSGYSNGSFDFSSDKLTIADNDILSPEETDMTLGAWINLDTLQSTLNSRIWIIAKGATANYEYALHTHGTGSSTVIAFTKWKSDGQDISKRIGATALSAGTWYHVVGVYNASTDDMSVYLNGSVNNGAASGTGTFTSSNGSAPVLIGQRGDGGNYAMDGHIYEPFYYDGLLDATAVSNIYNDGLDGTNGVGSGGGGGHTNKSRIMYLTMPLPQRMEIFGKKELEAFYAKIKYSSSFGGISNTM